MQGLAPELRSLMGVHVLYWKFEECADAEILDPPLTRHERYMLVRLEMPARMGVLARDMLALPSTVTATADALEAKGLLTRERDLEDRRAWRLRLTDAGDRARRDLMERARRVFRDITGLAPDEVDRLAALLDRASCNILETGVPEGLKK
ncbi:MarR family transcriptional regulator [Pukyongiella litopenaei]|uniref:MarR family transcriptional regulator n=2 Tax=Pukyongiella litopenaei TaxID=2605946 RepID=A0A2S0MMJ0_9RHOB|nr:MarR family transcriptional regulator [Pukyongiella litopenaei]